MAGTPVMSKAKQPELKSLIKHILTHWDTILEEETNARRNKLPSSYDAHDVAHDALTDLFILAAAIGKKY